MYLPKEVFLLKGFYPAECTLGQYCPFVKPVSQQRGQLVDCLADGYLCLRHGAESSHRREQPTPQTMTNHTDNSSKRSTEQSQPQPDCCRQIMITYDCYNTNTYGWLLGSSIPDQDCTHRKKQHSLAGSQKEEMRLPCSGLGVIVANSQARFSLHCALRVQM